MYNVLTQVWFVFVITEGPMWEGIHKNHQTPTQHQKIWTGTRKEPLASSSQSGGEMFHNAEVD